MGLFERMLELYSQGFACAQIMMILLLESENKENPDLIRAIGALNNGVRDSGFVCGSFLGAVAMISYVAGQGQEDEVSDPDYDTMVAELLEWFDSIVAKKFGGNTCPIILDGDKKNKLERCPKIVETTYNKTIDILADHDLI